MAEAGPSKSPSSSNPKSHFDSISSNSSKHVQLALGHGPPPVPPRRWTQDAENVFSTRNNRRWIHSDSLGGEESSPPLPKPRLSIKHEMRPTYLAEADADITAFSDEYDLGEYTTSFTRNRLLNTSQRTKVMELSTHSSNSAFLTAMLDPAILADVQRAMKMKARREARLRTAGPLRTDASPQSFFSNPSSPTRAPVPPGGNIAFPSINHAATGEDSVPTSDAIVPYPMPRSLDNGVTLDWSGKEAVEEPKLDRKWSLSINKRKTKDKAVSIPSPDYPSPSVPRDCDYEGLFQRRNPQTQLLMTRI
jgi:hypothetical protein